MKIPPWPTLTATLTVTPAANEAVLAFNGSATTWRTAQAPQLRAAILAYAAELAVELGRPIPLSITDVDGEMLRLAVHPEGIVQQLPENGVLPDADGLSPVEAPCRSCRRAVSIGSETCQYCDNEHPHRITRPTIAPTPQAPTLPTPEPSANTDETFVSPVETYPAPDGTPAQTRETPQQAPPVAGTAGPEENEVDERTIIRARPTNVPPARTAPAITLTTDGEPELTLPAPILIGRKPTAAHIHTPLRLESRTREISRNHASLTITDHGVTVTDLESANGTYINDRPVNSPTPVQPHDRIRIGNREFRARIEQRETAS